MPVHASGLLNREKLRSAFVDRDVEQCSGGGEKDVGVFLLLKCVHA